MIKKKLSMALLALACFVGMKAQVATSDPSPLQENSENVVIYFHADQGNKAMMGLSSSTAIYAHTGVITDKSTGNTDWKYATTWGTSTGNGSDQAKYKLTYVSSNLWKLDIGDIHTFYGVSSGETVKKLAFVFKTAGSSPSKEGKDTGNADIFVDVLAAGLQIELTSNPSSDIISSSGAVSFTANATASSTITIKVNGTQIASQSGVKTLTASYTFSTPGDYAITAEATSSGVTATATLNKCYVNASTAQNYPGGVPVMGPVRNADGSVTFCLGAPEKTSAILVGSWNDYQVTNSQVMNYQDYNGYRYFWTTVSGLDNDVMYPYFFIVDNSIKIADPYARLALDEWDQYIKYDMPDLPAYPKDKFDHYPLSVYQGSISDYNWKIQEFHGPSKENLVIYELLFRDFTGIEGQAGDNGTIRAAIEKFDHIKRLGVNAVELLPIMEFNGANSWGYNQNMYFAPDKAYGMPDDYKEFIDLCHENGIAVILDIVFNQADAYHPWCMLYGGWSQLSQNPFFNAKAPHDYSVLQDWNQDYALVDQQWKDCLQYWLKEYKVDGFRFDLVKGLGDSNSYGSGTEAYNSSRINRMKKLHGYITEIKPDAYHINENLARSDEENAMAADGQLNWANVNDAGCQYAMGYTNNGNMNRFNAAQDSRTWGSTVSYLESHDEQRLAYKQDQWAQTAIKNNTAEKCKRLGATAAQMILAPGAHMIWMFQEIGNAENTKNDDGSNNVNPKKVNWTLKNDPDHLGLYESYCELINIRTGNPALFNSSASVTMNCSTTRGNDGSNLTWNDGDVHTIYAVSADGTQELYLVANPKLSGSLTHNVPLKKTDGNYYVISKSYNTNPTFNATSGSLTVPANSYAVVARTTVTAIDDVVADSADAFKAYGTSGAVVLENVVKPVEIYTLDGRRVYQTAADGKVALNTGVYLVRSGHDTVKVAVK